MKILVTGGCGFIGANLIRQLTHHGHRVRVLDDLSTGYRKYINDVPVEFIRGDIRSQKSALRACKDMQGVVHLAAKAGVADSLVNPILTFDVNTMGALHVLDAAVKSHVKSFVLASTNAALGEQKPPLHEGLVASPSSPYGASKLACEALVSSFAKSYGMGATILRFANVYGPFCGHKNSVVAAFVRRALAGEPLVVYGDGHQTRDFVHVEDVCRAIRISLKRPSPGDVFQIGTGHETNVLTLAKLVQKLCRESDVPVPPLSFEPPRQEVLRNYSKVSKVAVRLGWKPKISLNQGLKKLWHEKGLRSVNGLGTISSDVRRLSGDI